MKEKKKKPVRNKVRDTIGDYYKTNTQYARDNRKQQDNKASKGFKNLTTTEKTYIAVILLGLIGIGIKYLILQ